MLIVRSFFSRIPGKLKDDRRLAAIVAVHAVFLSFFLFFNFKTGLFIDDYGYMYMFDRSQKLINDRVDSLAEVLRSQYAHYFIMNGRSVTHTMLQTVLMLGKGWFNFINTGFCFLLSWGMYTLARRPGRPHSPLLQLLFYAVPWVLFTEYGRIFLVCCMAVNYMWSMAVIVLVLIPFRRLFDGNDVFSQKPAAGAAIMLLSGIAAGWLSENGSAALLLIVGCMGLYYLLARKKIPLWCITGFAGMCAGFAAMILAPGYDVRSEGYGDYSYIHQFVKITALHLLPYYGYILAAFVSLLGVLWFRIQSDRQKRLEFAGETAGAAVALSLLAYVLPESVSAEWRLMVLAAAVGGCVWAAVRCIRAGQQLISLAPPVMLMLGGITATYVMIASPIMDTRSEFQFLILFTCGAVPLMLSFAGGLAEQSERKTAQTVLFTVLSLCLAASLVQTALSVSYGYRQFTEREEYILEQKDSGNYDLILAEYDIPDDCHAGMYNIVNEDPDYWINRAVCWYYGIDSVYYEASADTELLLEKK